MTDRHGRRTGARRLEGRLIGLAVVFCLFSWFFDAFVEAYLFGLGSLWQRLTEWNPPEALERATVCVLILTLAVTASVLISRRREAEARLLLRERGYRNLLESAHEGICVIDAQGRTTYANPRMGEMLGRSIETIRGNSIYDFMGPKTAARLKDDLAASKIGGREAHESEFRTGDGRRVFTRISVSPVLGAEGALAGALAFFSDVTNEREATMELKRSEERYRNVYASSPMAVVIWGGDGLVQDWNRRAEEVFGWARAEMVGRDFSAFLVPRGEEPEAISVLAGARNGTLPTVVVNKHLTKAGSEIMCEWYHTALRDESGELEAIASLGLDVTERERAVAELRDSIEEKEALLRELHHRVKNNLQIVSTLIRLQEDQAIDDAGRQVLMNSQSRVRAMSLVHDKLLRTGGLARVNFGAYLRDLVDQQTQAFGMDIRQVISRVEMDDDFELSMDTAVVCGLIVNELVTNSFKHAFPDGRRGEVRIRMDRPAGWSLTVEDDGVGLPSSFDYRGATSMGLMLVMALVRQLRGRIERLQGAGTRFVITFDKS